MDSLGNSLKTIKARVCRPLTPSKRRDSTVSTSLITVGITGEYPPSTSSHHDSSGTSKESSLFRALRRQKEYLMSEIYTWTSHGAIKDRARVILAQGACDNYEDAVAQAIQESLHRASGKCARMQGQYRDLEIPLEENDIVTMASTAEWRMQLMETRMKKDKGKGHNEGDTHLLPDPMNQFPKS